MQKLDSEWETIYQIKFSDRTIQSLTLRKAATHCDVNGLAAVVFLDDEEVGWCDSCGNSGVWIGARSLFKSHRSTVHSNKCDRPIR